MTEHIPPPSVLVVDDDPLELFFLERHLGGAGYDVVTADGSAAALELLRAMRFSLVITDWLMPGMDGPDLCRAVRARKDLDRVHLIMLTAHAEKARLVEAFDAGADDFLTKPCDPGELLARMRCGMRQVHLKADLAAREREIEDLKLQLRATAPARRPRILNGIEMNNIPRCVEAPQVYRTLRRARRDHLSGRRDSNPHEG